MTRTVESVVPIPAALVSWTPVTVAELRHNVAATRNFYENQDFASVGVRVDFTTEEGQKKLKLWERIILDKLVEDVVVMKLAAEHGIVITNGQAQERVQQEINRYGEREEAEDTVRKLWNFSMDDFVRYVVKPQLYREALEQVVNKQQDTTQLRSQILSAKAALDQGAEFTGVMNQYSDSVLAGESGEAVWFRRDELIGAVAQTVPTIPAGSYSDVIESARGFHIVAIDDRRGVSDDEMVLLRHIVIYTPSFQDWLDTQIRTMDISVPMKAYYWNTETAHIDFMDESMRIFEQEQQEVE